MRRGRAQPHVTRGYKPKRGPAPLSEERRFSRDNVTCAPQFEASCADERSKPCVLSLGDWRRAATLLNELLTKRS